MFLLTSRRRTNSKRKREASMSLYQSLKNRLENQQEAIPNIIHGMDEKDLTAQPEPGKWSIRDNIAHLAKLQSVYIGRVDRILNENEPHLQNYRAENDPEFDAWLKWDTKKLLERLNADRKKIFGTIAGLTDEELARIGIHSRHGRLTLVDWMEFMLLHEAHHILTIFRLVHNAERG